MPLGVCCGGDVVMAVLKGLTRGSSRHHSFTRTCCKAGTSTPGVAECRQNTQATDDVTAHAVTASKETARLLAVGGTPAPLGGWWEP
jgi:hypothetical protein